MSVTQHRDGLRYGRDALACLGGALAIAVAARLTFPLPGTELPQSAQTLAVLLVGAALGMRRGSLAVGTYVLVGALGLPVFADGGRGLETVLGPSGGYLLGFLVAAAGVGRFADRDELARPWWRTLLVMLAAHGVILALGGIGLVPRVGVTQAWSSGVAPFLLGGAVKSGIAAVAVWVATRQACATRRTRNGMRSEFSKSVFMSVSDDDARKLLCVQLGAAVADRLRGPAGFALEAQACIEALRALGHDLWSFDESPDFQVWAPNYTEPTGTGIIVTMWADGRAVVEWTPK